MDKLTALTHRLANACRWAVDLAGMGFAVPMAVPAATFPNGNGETARLEDEAGDNDAPAINPATGMMMMGRMYDVGGNVYGFDDAEH